MTKRKLSDISFEHEGAHVALVHKMQGGPANNQPTVLTKATKEVFVSMTFKEFLTKFFDLWSDEAEILSTALGFTAHEEGEEEEYQMTYREWIQSKADAITILKSCAVGDQKIEELKEEDFQFVWKAKQLFEAVLASETTEDNSNEDTTIEKSSDKNSEKEENMNPEEFLKSAEGQELIQKALADVEAKHKEELEKARGEANAVREELEKAKRADHEELVKGYSFVEENQRETLVKALMSEHGEVLAEVLEKARSAVAAAVTAEVGGEGDEQEDGDEISKSRSRVRDLIKARNEK